MRTPGRLTTRPAPSERGRLYACGGANTEGTNGGYIGETGGGDGGIDATNARHIAACWNAVEAIGGDPDTVGELAHALRSCFDAWGLRDAFLLPEEAAALDEARAVLTKIKP